MFSKTYTLYCYECKKKYTLKSKKELNAFLRGSGDFCPWCGERLYRKPFIKCLTTVTPAREYIHNIESENNSENKYDETFCETHFKEFKDSLVIKENEIHSLMNLAVVMHDRVWFNELTERLNSNCITIK